MIDFPHVSQHYVVIRVILVYLAVVSYFSFSIVFIRD